MARGKAKGVVSLKDSVPDSEIVRLGEIRNKPDYPFPDGKFGIVGKQKDYSLVTKRIAYRTGTVEDGVNNGKVIEYEAWEDYPCYVGTLEAVFESYAKILNLSEFKNKKMIGEIRELVEIHQNTHNIINKALKGIDAYLTKEQLEICELADTKQRLLEDIAQLKNLKTDCIKVADEINQLHLDIKEKHKIIVDVDKPKKHSIKEEK